MVLTKSEVKARYINQGLTAQEADQVWVNVCLQGIRYWAEGDIWYDFVWVDSPQGHSYWSSIIQRIES